MPAQPLLLQEGSDEAGRVGEADWPFLAPLRIDGRTCWEASGGRLGLCRGGALFESARRPRWSGMIPLPFTTAWRWLTIATPTRHWRPGGLTSLERCGLGHNSKPEHGDVPPLRPAFDRTPGASGYRSNHCGRRVGRRFQRVPQRWPITWCQPSLARTRQAGHAGRGAQPRNELCKWRVHRVPRR